MPERKKNSKNHTVRIGDNFFKEIDIIKKERLNLGNDKKRRSTRSLTNLIVRHDYWPEIRQAMINLNVGEIENE